MSEDDEKTGYLAVYDYGSGGVWAYIYARSKEEIAAKFPMLTIPEKRPAWMSEETYDLILSTNVFDIDEEPPEWLAAAMEANEASSD